MYKSLIGTKIGMLSVLEKKRENNRTYYYCKCNCGNSLWIRGDSLTKKNPTLSCGCLGKKQQFKAKDISNNKYGRLTAINPTDKKDKSNGSIIWECGCSCGNKAYIAEYLLEKGAIRSCGCLGKENSKENMRKAIKSHLDKNIVEGTNIKIISRDRLQSNNTSGVTGVIWNKAREKWEAKIRFKNKIYYLGRYKNKEDAIKARKEAEEKYFKEFLEKLNKNS